jgi:superfamily II DNA or RNA helicase
MRVRDYQRRCVDAVVEAMPHYRTMLCSVFTGAGKTVMFAHLANTYPDARILLIVPMRELAWQGADTFARWCDERPEIEMAQFAAQTDMWLGGGRVVVASRQTLLSGRGEKRYERFRGFDIVIVDEAHTQFSEPCLAMLRDLRDHGATVIGFTATPFRMDGKPLREFYEHTAFDYGLQAGIDDAWCVPPRCKLVRCTDLDLKQVSVSAGDYSASDLDMVMGCSRPLHQLCLTTREEREGPALAFLPGVRSAKAYAEMAASQYGMRAAWIAGSTYLQSEDERNRIINQFRRGELDVLANCQIATMGFDAPVARTVILGRPTKSRVLWLQIVGRVTRPESGCLDSEECHTSVEARRAAIAGSGKPWFKVVDITDCSASHSVRTAVDMFAAEGTHQEVIVRARQLAEEKDDDPLDLLAQAAEDVRKAKLLEEGLKAQKGQATGTLFATDVELGRKKCISEYRVPLRGKYAGRTMGECDDEYIGWAIQQPWLQPWQRSFFYRERSRRAAARRDSARAG